MKEILEKFGLSEFFAHICPGGILLSSLALWAQLKFDSPFWNREVLVAISVLLLSYTLGLILASFNRMALVRYLRSAPAERRGFLRKIRAGTIRLLYHFSLPRFTSSNVHANLRIAEDLARLAGVDSLPALAGPWDGLVIYRTFVADRVGERGKAILTEADTFHRRFLFSMGVALAVYLLAIQALIRFILHFFGKAFHESIFTSWNQTLPAISPFWLAAITIFGLGASLELRQIAIRMWELERDLTESLIPPVEE